MKISEMVQAQGLDPAHFANFIRAWGVDDTHRTWGFFDTYGRTNLLCMNLFGDVIVAISQESQHEMHAGGVGHKAKIYAVATDGSRRWECSELVCYVDQWDDSKDRIYPIPEQIKSMKTMENDQLFVTVVNPGGGERFFILKKDK